MNFAPYQWRAGEGYLPPKGSTPNPIFTMPSYPYMPLYGAPMPGTWAPPYPGNPYGPVLAAPPAKSARAASSAPPKPPVPSAKAASTKESPPTEEKATKTEVHFVSLHPTVAKLKSVKCGESSPGGDGFVTLEEWQKFCDATNLTKKVNPEDSLKKKLLKAGPPDAKVKSVSSAEFGSDFNAFLEWNKLRKEAKKAQEAADKKLAVKMDKTASEVAKAGKAKTEKSAKHSINSYAPPTIRPGVNYLFPNKAEHTMIHVFNKTSKLWDDKYKGTKQQFKIFKVATHWKVGQIIERVRRDKEKCTDWAVTEVVEAGDGTWKKGTTIPYGDDKAKGTLDSMGWNSSRGSEGRPPVWLVVHKA